ncbi:MAG: DUF1440 domain-containing protein [Caulobacteraceae bacterium]|nr:DUF1440 domain-containing protein [Caulobacter sp.]
MRRRPETDDLRAAAVGVAAGLLAAWIMDRWQAGASPLLSTYQEKAGVESPGGDATARAADYISELARGRSVSDDNRATAGLKVHYAFGALLGGLYGVVAGRWGGITAGFGSGFSLLVDLLFDEALVPAMRLSEPDDAYPASSHAYGVVSHLIFGVALEGGRRLLLGRAATE